LFPERLAGGPVPGQEFVQAGDQMVADAVEHCRRVGIGIETRELGRLDDRHRVRDHRAAGVRAGEEIVLPADRNRPSILPMSGRMLTSIIAGTLSTAAESGCS